MFARELRCRIRRIWRCSGRDSALGVRQNLGTLRINTLRLEWPARATRRVRLPDAPRRESATAMNIVRAIGRAFGFGRKSRETPPVIDHVRMPEASEDWRKRKLAEAAQKYGRPFKCAGDDMPHEVVMRGRIVISDDAKFQGRSE